MPHKLPLRLVIVGGVAGGMSAATRARRLDETANITVFEKGSYVSFANCGLPYALGGVIKSDTGKWKIHCMFLSLTCSERDDILDSKRMPSTTETKCKTQTDKKNSFGTPNSSRIQRPLQYRRPW